jgi:thiol-disulfide isomerase/thioredoxin
MAADRRLLVGSLAAAALISVAGGWALSALGSDTSSDDGLDTMVLEKPGTSLASTIGTTVDLQTNDGAVVSTADLVGTPLVLNVWNSTCRPCRKELPAFAAVHAELGEQVRFIGINTLDTPEVNESFARDRGVRYELLRDVDGAFTDGLGISTQPVTLFVAADGTIVRQSGVLDEATLRAYTEELLG